MFYKPVIQRLVQDLLIKYYDSNNYICYNDFYTAIFDFIEIFTVSNDAIE